MHIRHGFALFLKLLLIYVTRETIEGYTWRENVNCSLRYEYSRCRCDEECAQYGDCCVTSPYFVPAKQLLGASPFICYQIEYYNVYAMARCPKSFGNDETRLLCENPNSQNDPLLAAPITSTRTNITYQNWHCAACHDDLAPGFTQIWLAQFGCSCGNEIPVLLPPEVRRLVEGDFFNENGNRLIYNSETKMWHLNLPKNKTDEFNCTCVLKYTPPDSYDQFLNLRKCFATINKCAENWLDKNVQRQCEAYTDLECSDKSWYYRNPHCAICNYEEPKTCLPDFAYHSIGSSGKSSFSILLDWRRLKKSKACPKSEVYDPLARVCRQVYFD